MHKKYLGLILLLFSLILIFFSCKKEEDDISPLITIYSPNENQVFNVFDTIIVKASVSDENKLESIQVVLVDENLIPVLGAVLLNPEVNKVDIVLHYPINDFYLENGTYNILVKAFDGTNYKNSYKKIFINEAPTRLEYISVLSKTSSSSINISKIDSAFNQNFLFSINSDYSASALSSRHQQLYVAGSYIYNMNAYELEKFGISWTVQSIPNPPAAYFESLSYFDKKVYVSFNNGEIKAYDNHGALRFSTTVSTGMYPKKVFKHDDYLIVAQKNYVGFDGAIGVYYLISGVLKQKLPVNYNIVDYFSKDNDNIFVFGNDGNQGKILIYNLNDNNTWEPYSYQIGKIIDVTQIDNLNYLIAFENEIKHFKYNPISLTTYIPNVSAKNIKFEHMNNMIYTAENFKISTYNYPNAVSQNNVFFSDSILDFYFVYNK